MSLRNLSPLGPPPLVRRGAPSPPSVDDDLHDAYKEADPRADLQGGKWLARAGMGLTGLALLGGAAVSAGATLPVCQNTQQVVGWENTSPCVSLEAANGAATVSRYTQLPFHTGDALEGLQSGRSQLLNADAQPSNVVNSDELDVVSWNLRHGQSQQATGSRPQLPAMVETLKERAADVYLLQEVAPHDAGRIAEELGMKGYFAASSPVQGNLILLRPDMQVTGNTVAVTTGQNPEQSGKTLTDWIRNQGGASEPRNIQVLDVTLPGGREAVIWNTHNLTGEYPSEMHERASQIAVNEIQRHLQPGELVIGGGDLNARSPGHPLIDALSSLPGLQSGSEGIDWIFATNGLGMNFRSERVEANGIMVSDHVLVSARLSGLDAPGN